MTAQEFVSTAGGRAGRPKLALARWKRASAAPAAQACCVLVNGSHDSTSRYTSIPAARAWTS